MADQGKTMKKRWQTMKLWKNVDNFAIWARIGFKSKIDT